MEITQEMLQKQAEQIQGVIDGQKQGYLAALAWVSAVLNQKEEKAKEAEIVK